MPRNNQEFYQFNRNKKKLICVFCFKPKLFKKIFSYAISETVLV